MKPLKPSSTRKSQSDRKRSTTSWKIPQPADVISYAYLWAREAAEGQEEGLKDRPVVVTVARIKRQGYTEIVVAPITHSEPDDTADGLELPRSVKRQLGLDSDRSWIITSELNFFIWPGPDVRIAPGKDHPLYDAIPERLFDQLRIALREKVLAGRIKVTKRSS